MILNKFVTQGNLFCLAHGLGCLPISIGQRILIQSCLGHNHTQILQAFCLTGKYGFQLGVGLILTDIVKRCHISGQPSQRCGHLIGRLLVKSKSLGHCPKGAGETLGHSLRQTKGCDGVFRESIHLLGHLREGHIHHVLNFRQIGSQFHTGRPEIPYFLNRKCGSQSQAGFLGQTLNTCHLFIKTSPIDHQIKPDLAYTIRCHTQFTCL